jgi:transcriptional regulator with XRE-family HTH domain
LKCPKCGYEFHTGDGIYIGKNLRKLRRRRKVTQKQVAEATGLSRYSIVCYESNKARPKMENIQLIANAFSIEPEDLIEHNSP